MDVRTEVTILKYLFKSFSELKFGIEVDQAMLERKAKDLEIRSNSARLDDKEVRLQVSLTPAEGKRLIAKAIANMDVVRKALKTGTIVVSRSSTCGYVLEELLGKEIDKEKYVCGFVHPKGTCLTNRAKRLPKMAIVKGKIVELGNPSREALREFVSKMDKTDIFIKGANLVDPNWNAGILAGAIGGGYAGAVESVLLANKINVLIPVGLEKFIPTSIQKAVEAAGILKMDYSMGMPVDVLPLHGTVITELQATNMLFGAEAIPIGAGGLSAAEGSFTIVIKGHKSQIEKARRLIAQIKGEKRLRVAPMTCSICYTRKTAKQQLARLNDISSSKSLFQKPCPGFWKKE